MKHRVMHLRDHFARKLSSARRHTYRQPTATGQHSFLGRWKSFTSFHGTSWILRIRLRAWDDEKSRPMRDVGPDAGYIINVVRIWFPGNRLQDSERLSVHTACRSVCSLCTCLALMSTPTFQINSFNLRLFDLCVQSADISPKCSPT